MKKIFLSVALALISMAAMAWTPDFSLNNNRFSVGLHGGVVALGTEHQGAGIGFNVTAFGVSVDYVGYGPEHIHTPRNDRWNDSEAFSVNLGYHIPLFSFLSVYPVVGYSNRSDGVTDGANHRYSVDDEDYSVTRINKYTRDWTEHRFNYGCGIAVTVAPWLTIYAVGSRNAIYGGLGLNFSKL